MKFCRLPNISLRRKLIWSIMALAILPLMTLGVILCVQSFYAQLEEIKKFQSELTKQESLRILDFLHEQDQKVEILLRSLFLPDLDKAKKLGSLSKFLIANQDTKHDHVFNEAILTDAKGMEKIRVSRKIYIDPSEYRNISSEKEFSIPFGTGKKYTSPVVIDAVSGTLSMKRSYPLKDPHSLKVMGVLVLTMDLRCIQELIDSLKMGKNGATFLTDSKGKVIAHRDNALVFRETTVTLGPPALTHGHQGEFSVVCSSPIVFDGTTFHLVTELPLFEMFRHMRKVLFAIAALLVLSLSNALLLIFALIHQIIKPIEHLAFVSKEIHDGKAAYAVCERNDEIGNLASTFNLMTSKLFGTIEDLKAEKELVKHTLSSIATPFYLIDANNYTVEMANEASGFGVLTNKSRCHKLTHDSDVPCHDNDHPCPIELIKQTRKPVVVEHTHVDPKTNEKRHFEIYGYPMFDEKQNISKIIEYSVDITERKALEAQLRQSQKMEALGSVAGGVAHDFNNILTAIIGYSELMLSSMPLDAKMRECVEAINNAGLSASNLTRQLLAFSRKQAMELKICGLNELIRNMMKMLSRIVGENIEIEVSLTSNGGVVKVDPSQMEQVIMNLVVNAKDAMKGYGQLRIETRNMILDDKYIRKRNWDIAEGRYVVLTVSDDGEGIPKDIQDKIFDPFFSTKGANGTGLGLSTIYGIIKQIKGHIVVESETDSGTTFKVFIPETEETPTKSTPKQSEDYRGNETILVVDDDRSVASMVKESLTCYGYEVIMAEDTLEVIKFCENKNIKIDLLLSDIIMPVVNGVILAEKAKTLRPNLKILLMSGYTDDVIDSLSDDEKEKMSFSMIRKPFSPQDLTKKIRDVLDC